MNTAGFAIAKDTILIFCVSFRHTVHHRMNQAIGKVLFFAFIFGNGLLLMAQPNPQEYRALQNKYKAARTDSARIFILTDMAWLYRKYDKAQALGFCTQALKQAEKIEYDEGIGFAKMAMGNVYNYHANYDSALSCYRYAIPYFEKISFETTRNHRLGQIYYNLAQSLQEVNQSAEAIQALNNAARFYQLSQDKAQLSNVYIDIANLYETNKQYKEALFYGEKALTAATQVQDTTTICSVMNDLGNIYLALNTQTKNATYLAKAKADFLRTYRILQHNPEADTDGLITPTILANLGDCLLREEKYDSAIYFLNESNRLASKIQYKWVEGYNYMYLGEIAHKRQQLKTATDYFEKALGYRKDYGNEFTMDLYQRLTKLETDKRNFAKALEYQQLYQQDYEQVRDAEQSRAINEIQTRYETHEKERQIQDLQRDNRQKKQYLTGVVILALLAVALAVAIGWLYHFRRKVFRQREHLLHEEKEKVELERQIEEKAKEKAQLQQQLTEKENQRIQEEIQLQATIHSLKQDQLQREIDYKQRELTTSVMQLEKKNELLLTLKNELQQVPAATEKPIRNLNRLIDQSLDIEDDFERFTTHFENVHPRFFHRLQSLTEQSLSALDQKYCAYLRMQLSTKEIANLLNIEPKSVRMAQYRIKKKLGLTEENDLKEFLHQL